MSVPGVSLAGINAGEHAIPVEQSSVKVVGGPWQPKGSRLFRRSKGESVQAWRDKVLKSARDSSVLSSTPAASLPACHAFGLPLSAVALQHGRRADLRFLCARRKRRQRRLCSRRRIHRGESAVNRSRRCPPAAEHRSVNLLLRVASQASARASGRQLPRLRRSTRRRRLRPPRPRLARRRATRQMTMAMELPA